MRNSLILILTGALFMVNTCSKKPASMDELKNILIEKVNESEGIIAIAFEDLKTGDQIFINEKIEMHAASTMKVPVMIEVFKQAEQGNFNLDDSISIKNEFTSIVDSSKFVMSFEEDSDDVVYQYIGKKMAIYDLIYQMITVSSNFATNILIDLVEAENVMETMQEIDARDIKVLRGVEDIKAYEKGMNNTTTAYDMLLVMKAIANKAVVTDKACQEMIDILADQKFTDKIPALLPSDVRVANKTGSITEIDHDAAIVYLKPAQAYVLVVLTKGIKDHKQAQNQIAEISKMIYDTVKNQADN